MNYSVVIPNLIIDGFDAFLEIFEQLSNNEKLGGTKLFLGVLGCELVPCLESGSSFVLHERN
jgi:hypothetical protein